MQDVFGTAATIATCQGSVHYRRLRALEEQGLTQLQRLPITVQILLEQTLRACADHRVSADEVERLAAWPQGIGRDEIAFSPARVLMQDHSGVTALVDLVAVRAALERAGHDPGRAELALPVDLVVDHSIQVDTYGVPDAAARNMAREYARNEERYAFLRWAERAFADLRVVPPGHGIVHQVHLERLATVVQAGEEEEGARWAWPDTVLGTDSHTPMVNALGVLGWGVGGLDAEAVLLGEPVTLLAPRVHGLRLTGALPPGATATDLALTVTEVARRHGVVGDFLEAFGPGLQRLPVADRATVANMSPEYGATACLFPVDELTLAYLRLTGRPAALVDLIARYARAQGWFGAQRDETAAYTSVLELDLSDVEPSVAGPRRPHDRLPLPAVPASFPQSASGGGHSGLRDGAVAIAALTSCTNTSNPRGMLAAGLVARRAVERGLSVPPWVKTSMAPGSRVVPAYLERAGLLAPLQALGFHVVGYGCTTCIGNSGPLPADVEREVEDRNLRVVAVLSGNRNFEGRIHPQVRASYLASPPLVVAYALAGTIRRDLTTEPLGEDEDGRAVHLHELWPTPDELDDAVDTVSAEMFAAEYEDVFAGDERWAALPVDGGAVYRWRPGSTYLREPPFLADVPTEPVAHDDLRGARALVVLGDSVTTDHISPAGAIPRRSPAGRYLLEQGVPPAEFSTYGCRRADHEVMRRGTFASSRLRNGLVGGEEGGWTVHLPGGERMTVDRAAERYASERVPLIVLAGREYGFGSSRDWAAKGPALLGVRAVIAESFERIHRANLVAVGILPLQHVAGQTLSTLALDGTEAYTITGLARLVARGPVHVEARRGDGSLVAFRTICRADAQGEVLTLEHGGLLPQAMRRLLAANGHG